MRAEYINPFITSLDNAFQTMLCCEVKRGPLRLRLGNRSLHEVSGIIGLSGRAVGTVVLSLSREVALRAASTLLLMDATELNDDVVDAVGELTNVVAGGAKSRLEQYELSISLPNVITGIHHEIRFPSNVSPICVPFTTQWGPLVMEVGLSEVAVRV
jgi:chemotaxis protein CheX